MLQCENLISKYSVSCEVAGQIQNEKTNADACPLVHGKK
jgi:hypothetical protein